MAEMDPNKIESTESEEQPSYTPASVEKRIAAWMGIVYALMFFFIIIFVLTSGLVSPVSSMPDWAQEVTRLNPVRYIIAALREIFLKGSTFTQLLPQFIPLCIYSAVTMTSAVICYRKKQ